MPVETVITVLAVIVFMMVFIVTLAWADYYTNQQPKL